MVQFDDDSLYSWLEEIKFLIEVIKLEWELDIRRLKSGHLSFLFYLQPLKLKTQQGNAINCVFALAVEI
jgi:hypothetical protein